MHNCNRRHYEYGNVLVLKIANVSVSSITYIMKLAFARIYYTHILNFFFFIMIFNIFTVKYIIPLLTYTKKTWTWNYFRFFISNWDSILHENHCIKLSQPLEGMGGITKALEEHQQGYFVKLWPPLYLYE